MKVKKIIGVWEFYILTKRKFEYMTHIMELKIKTLLIMLKKLGQFGFLVPSLEVL